MNNNIFKEKWQEILEGTRENYIHTITTLTNNQKEIEELVKKIIKDYNLLTQKQIDKAFELVNNSLVKREEFIYVFKKNIYRSLEIMPNIEDVMFKKHFDELSALLKNYYYDFFT